MRSHRLFCLPFGSGSTANISGPARYRFSRASCRARFPPSHMTNAIRIKNVFAMIDLSIVIAPQKAFPKRDKHVRARSRSSAPCHDEYVQNAPLRDDDK